MQDVTLTYTDIQYMFTKVPLSAAPGPLEFSTKSDEWSLDFLASDLTVSGTPPTNNRQKFGKVSNLCGHVTCENKIKIY